MGVGVSGGENGARHGPSLMPGGPKEAYERVDLSLRRSPHTWTEYLASHTSDRVQRVIMSKWCIMESNTVLMQLIAESYDLMKRGLELSDAEVLIIYGNWNEDVLNAYLIEITSRIFTQVDERTGKRLIDVILDEAKQKGTGMWTSQDAMDIQVPTPVIDAAVVARNLSAMKSERESASKNIKVRVTRFKGDRDAILNNLKARLYISMIITYAQGNGLNCIPHLKVYEYGLNLEDVARIWRGGCIIRAVLLDKYSGCLSCTA